MKLKRIDLPAQKSFSTMSSWTFLRRVSVHFYTHPACFSSPRSDEEVEPNSKTAVLSRTKPAVFLYHELTCARKTSTPEGRITLSLCSAVTKTSKSFEVVTTFNSPLRPLFTPIAPSFTGAPPFGRTQTM